MTEDERVTRFEAAYNRLDKALDAIAGESRGGRRRTYASKVRVAANRVPRLSRHVDFMLEVGDLRNAIVHNRLGDGTYLAVPSEATVLELEEVESRLSAPEQVLPRYGRSVQTLDASDTLARAWELVRSTGHSRFPVYDNGAFIGLLTANGFTRFCAGAAVEGSMEINGRKVEIREVLLADHRRDDVAFVAGTKPIDDVAQMFRENARLEAVIITENGRPAGKPLGIICAADLLGNGQ